MLTGGSRNGGGGRGLLPTTHFDSNISKEFRENEINSSASYFVDVEWSDIIEPADLVAPWGHCLPEQVCTSMCVTPVSLT